MDARSTMRRTLTVAAGAIALGVTLTAAPASAATPQQAHASVLMKVTPAALSAGTAKPEAVCTGNGICNCPKPN